MTGDTAEKWPGLPREQVDALASAYADAVFLASEYARETGRNAGDVAGKLARLTTGAQRDVLSALRAAGCPDAGLGEWLATVVQRARGGRILANWEPQGSA